LGRALSHHIGRIARRDRLLRGRISRRNLRCGRNVSSVVSALSLMGIEEEIERQEQRLRVACKEQTKKKYWHQHGREKLPHRQIVFPFQKTINRKTHNAADAIVDRPDGHQVIAGFAFIRISATRTAVERAKPVAQRTYFSPRHEDPTDSARRTSQPHRAAEVTPGRSRCARLFHVLRIRRIFAAQRQDYLS
jgi:hypothetical protein